MPHLSSHDGVITTIPITATYAVASNCTGRATVTVDGRSRNLAFVVTSTGFLNLNQTTGVIAEGFGVKQGSPTCTNAGVKGSFGFKQPASSSQARPSQARWLSSVS